MASSRNNSRDQPENLEFIRFTNDWMKSMQSTSPGSYTEELTVEQHVMGALKMVDVSHGRCVCRLNVCKKLQNRYGSLHGGVIATLVDVVGSAALMTIVGPPGGVSTDINVSYITAAWNEEEVEVDSVTLRAGKSLAVAEVTLRRIPSREIVAQGRHTKFLAIGPKAKL